MDIRSPGILVWSPADPDSAIDVGIQGCLFQIYPILLSTLLSIDRQQLSLFDAQFAISVSSSPLTLYLVVASIGDILRFKTRLYKRIKHRHPIRTSLILVPFLWFGLSMTLRLSSRAFKDSQLCDGSTFADWLNDMRLFLSDYLVNPGLFAPSNAGIDFFALSFLLCLFRRRSLVLTKVRGWKRPSNPWGRLLIPGVFVRYAWYVSVVVDLRLGKHIPPGVLSKKSTHGA
jgi:hypothetical protein